jgi:hypothetical protein
VAEFRAKKFSPPQRPVACEEEAASLAQCYRCVSVRAYLRCNERTGVVSGVAGVSISMYVHTKS